MSLDKLLSADRLFNPEPGAPFLIYGIIGILYLLLLVASILVYHYRKPLFDGHALKTKLAARVATAGIVLGAIGVILVGLRYLQVPILSARILIYLLVLVSLGLLAYLIYYLVALYPARLAHHEAAELRRRYLPHPKGKPGTAPTRLAHARKKSKKRR